MRCILWNISDGVSRLIPGKFRKTIMSAAVIRPSAAPSSGVRVVSCPFSASPRRSGSAEAPPDKVTPATFPVARQSSFAETSRSSFGTFGLGAAKPSQAKPSQATPSQAKPSLYLENKDLSSSGQKLSGPVFFRLCSFRCASGAAGSFCVPRNPVFPGFSRLFLFFPEKAVYKRIRTVIFGPIGGKTREDNEEKGSRK